MLQLQGLIFSQYLLLLPTYMVWLGETVRLVFIQKLTELNVRVLRIGKERINCRNFIVFIVLDKYT